MIFDLLTPREMLQPKDSSDPKVVEYWEKRRKSWPDRALNAMMNWVFEGLYKITG